MPLPFGAFVRVFLLAVGVTTFAAGQTQTAPTFDPSPIGLVELGRFDHLPRFRKSIEVGMISSYDRTGGNDDGFSGRYSYLRKERDGLVLAELKGPGVIYRIATPTPSDDIMEFYFDGEETPRLSLPFRALFDGTTSPFLAPLVGVGSGGNWSYVPMPYAKSCKIMIRAPRLQFYQINYATFPDGTDVKSFSPQSLEQNDPALVQARRMLARTGRDLSASVVPVEARLHVVHEKRTLAPGKTVTLFEAKRGGRIAGIRLSPASVLAGNNRDLVLKMTWDDAASPAVLCPAGDYFGYAWGEPAARSLMVGTTDETCYSYFPMPYDQSAKIELSSDGTGGTPVEVTAEIVYADFPRQPDEGRFYATWRRENPTTAGQPFTFVDVQGHGQLVGVMLQAQGQDTGFTGFFEGDDRATIDGKLVIHGTGSEDFFNGGWYDVPGKWEAQASYPLSGCLGYLRPQSRSGGYRLFLTDAYAFRKSLLVDIEHGPDGNREPTDYVGVSYLYLENPPARPWTLPAVSNRAVQDSKRLVYNPGWYQPAVTFSIQNATLSRRVEKIAGADVRFLSMQAERTDVFGPHHLALFCDTPAAGRYRVSIEMMKGPEQGVVQLFENAAPMGPPQDGRAMARGRSELLPMGELKFKAGTNRVFFVVTGPAKESRPFRFDLVKLVLDRLD